MEFTTKQGDTRTALKATLTPVDGAFENVSKVFFCMSDTLFNEKINREVDVQDLPAVIVVFKADEIAEAGMYYGEFVVEYTDGKIETIPNNDYIKIKIGQRLGE